jgi:hypothetical protein
VLPGRAASRFRWSAKVVSAQAEAAADDLLHDLGGAAEDRLDAAEPPGSQSCRRAERSGAPAGQGRAPSGQDGPWRSRGAIWAAITRHRIVWPRRNVPSRGVAPTTNPEPAAADIPAVDADVDAGQLIGARLPQNSRDARSRPRQPGAVVPPRAATRRSVPRPGSRRSPRQHGHVRRSMTTVAARPPAAECQGGPGADAVHVSGRACGRGGRHLLAGSRPARHLRCLGARGGAGNRIMRAPSAGTAQELRDPLRSWPGQPDDAIAAGA